MLNCACKMWNGQLFVLGYITVKELNIVNLNIWTHGLKNFINKKRQKKWIQTSIDK